LSAQSNFKERSKSYVADKVGITSIDKNRNLLENAWNETVEWLHPVTLEKEISVDVEVAAVVGAYFYTKFGLNFLLVEILADPPESRVTQVARVLTLSTDIVDILIQLVDVSEVDSKILPVQFVGKGQSWHCCNIWLLGRKTRRSRCRSSSGSGFGSEEEHSP
jgi:hypothetical protein